VLEWLRNAARSAAKKKSVARIVRAARMIGAPYAIGLKAERSRMVGTPFDFVASRCAVLPPEAGAAIPPPPQASRRIATPDLGLGWIPEPAAASGTRKFRDCCCPNPNEPFTA
jgi:hypothetical protein